MKVGVGFSGESLEGYWIREDLMLEAKELESILRDAGITQPVEELDVTDLYLLMSYTADKMLKARLFSKHGLGKNAKEEIKELTAKINALTERMKNGA
jgi:hypothetical protein